MLDPLVWIVLLFVWMLLLLLVAIGVLLVVDRIMTWKERR